MVQATNMVQAINMVLARTPDLVQCTHALSSHAKPQVRYSPSGAVTPTAATPGHVRHAPDVATTTACPPCMHPLPLSSLGASQPQTLGSQCQLAGATASFMSAQARVQMMSTQCNPRATTDTWKRPQQRRQVTWEAPLLVLPVWPDCLQRVRQSDSRHGGVVEGIQGLSCSAALLGQHGGCCVGRNCQGHAARLNLLLPFWGVVGQLEGAVLLLGNTPQLPATPAGRRGCASCDSVCATAADRHGVL